MHLHTRTGTSSRSGVEVQGVLPEVCAVLPGGHVVAGAQLGDLEVAFHGDDSCRRQVEAADTDGDPLALHV